MRRTLLILIEWTVAVLAFNCSAADREGLTLSADFNQPTQVMRGGMGASWHAMETSIPIINGRSHGGSGWGG